MGIFGKPGVTCRQVKAAIARVRGTDIAAKIRLE